MRVKASSSRLPATYWRLLFATGADNIGTGAYVAAAPLLALTLTSDPRLVTAISTATYLPWLLLSLPAGALVDRVNRIGLMWRTQAVAAVLVAITAGLVASDRMSIVILAVMAFALGLCDVVFGNAAQAVLPDIVPRHQLHRANGNQQAVITAGQQFAGPPLGSGLFAITPALPFVVDACSFAMSGSLLATVPRRPQPERERPSMRAAMGSGLRWLVGHRLLRTLAALLGFNNFCGQMAYATLVLLATQTLHIGIAGYGVFLAAAAIGSVFGGLVNARIVRRFGALPSLTTGLIAAMVTYFGMGFSTGPIVLGLFLAANGFAATLWNIVTTTLRQQLVPSAMLGRVNSVYKMLGWGLIPLGTLTGGLVAHSFGLRAPHLLAGVLRAIALFLALPVLLTSMRAEPAT